MKKRSINCIYSIALSAVISAPAFALTNGSNQEKAANTVYVPRQILKSGVSLTTSEISPNSLQLSDNIGLTPILMRIKNLKQAVSSNENSRTLETISAKQDLWEANQQAILIIQKTDLEIDFALAEIGAENQVYNEVLTAFTNDRDSDIAKTNALSFISNGILWAICESLAIPTYKNAKYAIPSGIVGIQAGVVPSIASLWTLKQLNGKKRNSEFEPNMLAKLFGYPTNAEIEYPNSVWQYLNQVPADELNNKKRLDQIVDRWIADANMHSFTSRHSKKQLDILTGGVSTHKGLSINTLTARSVMLQQLAAEIMKMKRMLLELTMVVQGEKELNTSN